ncbi:MAG: hypothetical protein KGJ09_07160 [Candidatus Omnitrophica bacterium]|nr:hypothetical protein [Candidatus Omnitrophota bacterium]MDE2214379.1 hypothetical protein [Candidatus Omnitrophota bacterium]MDE2231128.1 hypothetical protein [Candidatus Omnitrophota bacterium]
MYIPFYISLIFQVACAIHALKNGKPQWLWIIILFPVIGCLVYLGMEVLPYLRPMTDSVAANATNLVPAFTINKLKAELEVCDTVKNRLTLAAAYAGAKQYDQALEVLGPCRKGPYGTDAVVMGQFAECHFQKGEYQSSKECLLAISGSSKKFENQKLHLLYAKVLEKLGDKEAALKEYEALMQYFVGEEARCQYALLLKEDGRTQEARNIFEAIVKKRRISPPFYRSEQRTWFNIAQNELNAGVR